jgi:(E)-4-hydroxy-3-methylbut-2-enyl-diphosphate synthase
MARRRSRPVRVGDLVIGGGSPVIVQSMTNTPTTAVRKTIDQVKRLVDSGCEIVRLAVPNKESVRAFAKIKKATSVPLVADIHFDYRLAVAALDAGADKIRINPGNIGSPDGVGKIVSRAKRLKRPIRIGVNSGSLERDLRDKIARSKLSRPAATARAMVESALRHLRLLEDMGFCDIIVSLKSPDVKTTVAAHRALAKKCDYPFHLGITEAGMLATGTVKSAVGLGILLAEGIGDTIRVSLTAEPEHEVRVAFEILKALGLRHRGPEIISCPVCGRCQIDIAKIAASVERRTRNIVRPLRIAVMGCVVNGPGEARDADIGIAGGKGHGVLFRHGETVRKVEESKLADTLVREARKLDR